MCREYPPDACPQVLHTLAVLSQWGYEPSAREEAASRLSWAPEPPIGGYFSFTTGRYVDGMCYLERCFLQPSPSLRTMGERDCAGRLLQSQIDPCPASRYTSPSQTHR